MVHFYYENISFWKFYDMDKKYSDEVTGIVHGFMQVWNRYEATLSKELAQIQQNLQEMHPDRGPHPNTNYELFYRACYSIYPDGDITMKEFSNSLAVPLSTATRIADWLVENGYIQRLPDLADRRVVRITLTDTGRTLYQSIDLYVQQRAQQILAHLNEKERSTLITLIGKVVAGLDEAAK
jgi:DNA-binding MarR family transcriptional regulator